MIQQSVNAVIVEIRGRKAAAMTQTGAFVRIDNKQYAVGQEILLEPEAVAKPVRRARMTAYASMAAGFLLLLLGGFKGYTMPAGVVSLDVNPSFEYTINLFDRVLDITAVNDDAKRILADMETQVLLYRPVDEAVDATILALRKDGFFIETENDVVIATSSLEAGHTERIAERLGARVGQQDDLTVFSVPVSKHEVLSAHALGTSAGKLHIVGELEDSWTSTESFDTNDWIRRPVREIIYETTMQREGNEEDSWPTDSSSGAPSNETNEDTGESRKSDSSTEEQKSTDPSRKGEGKEGSREP